MYFIYITIYVIEFCCVIASTNYSIFFFHGANSLEIIFSKYQTIESVQRAESPNPVRSHTSLLSVFYSEEVINRETVPQPNSFLFTNGKTLKLYKLDNKELNFILQDKNTYELKYAKREDSKEARKEVGEMPLAIGLSQFHYLLLHSDCLTVISRITEKVVQFYDKELRQMGNLLGMQYDRFNQEFWIYSDRAVCKLVFANEDQDVWKLLMDKQSYNDAYLIAKKHHNPLTSYIAGLSGDQLFQQKEYIEAAKYYLRSSKSFEEIFMIFISSEDVQATVGLQYYLKELFVRLKEKQQRTIILSWLTELYVYRLNRLSQMERLSNNQKKESERQKELSEKQQEKNQLQKEFRDFLEQYNNDLDQDTVYQIMQSHGRIGDCVTFAQLNNNFEMIILHYINEENYKSAIENLGNVQNKNSLEVIQKYSYILMQKEPTRTLALLLQIKTFDPSKIIGGLMNIEKEHINVGIRFLEDSIKKLTIKNKSIHNIFIFFLAKSKEQERLISYLREKEQLVLGSEVEKDKEKIYFDLDFALRIFQGDKLIQPQIIIYAMMGLYTESVDMALRNGLTDVAKDYAGKPQNDDEKKKLWMMIAVHLLKNDENIDEVIELTKETDLIKIEDLLPHFNENIKIEHFKDEICKSLKNYNEEIEKLKEEMKKFSSNSEQLKNELKMIKNKFLIIDTQQKCENCFKHLFNDAFYLFPCNHGFHKVQIKYYLIIKRTA